MFWASKPLRTDGDIGQRRVTAVAVREHVTSKFSKLLRFMHAVPPGISTDLNNWIAVTKPNIHLGDTLFSGSNVSVIKIVETALSEVCVPLTMGQRCADWFILHQFRVTGTNAGIILARSQLFLVAVGLSMANETSELSSSEWFSKLYQSWFFHSVSTEAMKRGSANEGPVISCLRGMSVIMRVFDVG